MPLTEKGYNRLTYNELLEQQEQRAKNLFGEDIDTSEKTVLGKYIRLNVLDLANIYEDLEGLYTSIFVNTSRGINLDRTVALAGITRNQSISARHKIKILGTANETVNLGFLVSYKDVNFYTIDDYILDENGEVTAVVECVSLGTVGNVKTIDTIVNASSVVEKIKYLELIQKGSDIETDVSLRNRFKNSIVGIGSTTKQSLISAINQVPNVSNVSIIENSTDEIIDNRPPHSFEVYVTAPISSDYKIAEAILSKKPLGIMSVGNISVDVLDSDGYIQNIKFSHTEEVKIYCKIDIRINSDFPEDGIIQIKENLIKYILAFSNGDSVILTSFYGKIHSVSGVLETKSLKLSSDGVNFKSENITCFAYQIIVIDENSIEVNINE